MRIWGKTLPEGFTIREDNWDGQVVYRLFHHGKDCNFPTPDYNKAVNKAIEIEKGR